MKLNNNKLFYAVNSSSRFITALSLLFVVCGIFGAASSAAAQTTPYTRFDFDGDGRADYAVFRPSEGIWYIRQSQNGFLAIPFGTSTDLLTPADYDGDGKFDIGVFRPSTGAWYYRRSSDNQIYGVAFGQAGDIPRPGDFDGDGKADISVFRPSDGIWYRLNSSNGQFVAFQFGQAGDEPQIADMDGDGKSDYTVFRRGGAFAFFWVESSTGTVKLLQINQGDAYGYVPNLADYNGDRKTDIAYYYNTYAALRTPECTYVYTSLVGQKIPVSADYDGDGKANSAVFLVNSGTWSYSNMPCTSDLTNFVWGLGTDKPVEAAYNQ